VAITWCFSSVKGTTFGISTFGISTCFGGFFGIPTA